MSASVGVSTLTVADLKRLILDLGVPPAALSWTASGSFCPVMRGRAAFDGSGGFRFSADGVSSYVMAVNDERDVLIDVMAFNRGGWALLKGATGVVGVDAAAVEASNTVEIFDEPLAWLRSGRRGLLVVTPHRYGTIVKHDNVMSDKAAPQQVAA